MPDLPDYYTQVMAIEAEAYSIRGGADAAKSASPTAKDVYLATDTEKLWYCVADGAWADYFINASDVATLIAAGIATHAALTATHGATGAIVGTTNTQTLTNKTLTTPVIASIYQDAAKTKLLTMPAATDTLIGRATTDTLTNKTLTSPTINGTIATTGLTLPAITLGGTVTVNGQTFDIGTGQLTVTASVGWKGMIFQISDNTGKPCAFYGRTISTNPAAGDNLFAIGGDGRNSADENTSYVNVRYRITDPTDGAENGQIDWRLINAGSSHVAMSLSHDGFLTLAGGIYLKTDYAEPTRAEDTIYQNTTDKMRLVTVTARLDPDEAYDVLIGTASPPTTTVATPTNATNADYIRVCVTFIVPPDYYYEVSTSAGAPSIDEWHEWDLY